MNKCRCGGELIEYKMSRIIIITLDKIQIKMKVNKPKYCKECNNFVLTEEEKKYIKQQVELLL